MKFNDFGKIHAFLPELSPIEKVAISKTVLFKKLIKLSCSEGEHQMALRSHVIAFPTEGVETLASLPRTDFEDFVETTFIGEKSVRRVVQNLKLQHSPLILNFDNCMIWLRFLKEHNHSYSDIDIPNTNEEIELARTTVNNKFQERLLNVAIATDISVEKMKQRLQNNKTIKLFSQESSDQSLDEDTCVTSHYLITKPPHLQNPNQSILESLQDKLDEINC